MNKLNDIEQIKFNNQKSEKKKRISQKGKSFFERIRRFVKLHFLHTHHTPHEIALGAAIGLFIAWTPAMGLHILMVLALTAIFRASKLIALILVWINNPFTAVAFYYPSYVVGKFLLKPFAKTNTVNEWRMGSELALGPLEIIKGIFTVQFWQHLLNVLLKVGLELWVGTTVLGLLVAVVSYLIIYKLIIWYRIKNPRRRFLLHKQS